MANVKTQESQNDYNNRILKDGVGAPYLALFDENRQPIRNPLTGIPLGAYISSFSYKYDEEHENLATLVIDTGNPDTVDIPSLQENSILLLQWGYSYSDGSFVSGPVKPIQIRDSDVVFDSTGTHVTIKCLDIVAQLRSSPAYTPSEGNKFLEFLNSGCGNGMGIIIEKFE